MGEGGDEAAARAARRILGAETGRWAQQRAGAPAVDGSFFSRLLAGARALAWRAWEPSTRASRTSAVQQWFVFIYLLGVSGYMLDVTQRPPEAVLVAYLYLLVVRVCSAIPPYGNRWTSGIHLPEIRGSFVRVL